MPLSKSEQSRINGAKSRGPKTEAGKRKSAMNACKHGLTSALIVHHNENDEQFQLLLAAFTEKFQPSDPVEQELVFEAAVARFQLRRVWAMETAAMDCQMDRHRNWVDGQHRNCDEETRTAIAYEWLGDRSKVLGLLSRYHSRVRRDFEKAIRDLEHMRSSRTLTQPKLLNEPKPAAKRLVPVAINAPQVVKLPNEPNPEPARAVPAHGEPPQTFEELPDPPPALRIVTNPTNRSGTP